MPKKFNIVTEVVETLTSVQAQEILAEHNNRNRPMRPGLARQWRDEILRGKWMENGDPIVFDADGELVEGQHRLQGLVLAAQQFELNPTYYKTNFDVKTVPVLNNVVIVRGIDPASADTLGIGQKRTNADIVYRKHMFENVDDIKDAVVKRWSRNLATAARLVWLRSGGAMFEEIKRCPPTELLDFIENHPQLKDWTRFVDDTEAGSEKYVTTYIAQAPMIALLYLTSNKEGATEANHSLAENFLLDFVASGGEDHFGNSLGKKHPISVVKHQFAKMASNKEKRDRDYDFNLLVNAMLAYEAGEEVTLTKLKPKANQPVPRLGGMDAAVVELEAADEEE